MRAAIIRNEDASKLNTMARRHGMRNLREDGWLKVSQGVTTPDEVIRVTQEF
jgi:type II secretory ATPase GspE/PulE/Tfp pilus assembly ATPase PilB-like protein